MTNKEKRWQNWEKMRQMGKWKYILIQGLLICGILFFFIRSAFDLLFNDGMGSIIEYAITAIVFGLVFGTLNWSISEAGYKKYLESKVER